MGSIFCVYIRIQDLLLCLARPKSRQTVGQKNICVKEFCFSATQLLSFYLSFIRSLRPVSNTSCSNFTSWTEGTNKCLQPSHTYAGGLCVCVKLKQTQPCGSYEDQFYSTGRGAIQISWWKGGEELRRRRKKKRERERVSETVSERAKERKKVSHSLSLTPSCSSSPGRYFWLGCSTHDRIRSLGHRTNRRSAGSNWRTRARFSPCTGRTETLICLRNASGVCAVGASLKSVALSWFNVDDKKLAAAQYGACGITCLKH